MSVPYQPERFVNKISLRLYKRKLVLMCFLQENGPDNQFLHGKVLASIKRSGLIEDTSTDTRIGIGTNGRAENWLKIAILIRITNRYSYTLK